MTKYFNAKLPVLALAGLLVLPTCAWAERLGLHITSEELGIWRERTVSGPYKSTGDVSVNSPGDWDRILQNANSFLANPSAEIWVGQTSGVFGTLPDSTQPQPSRNQAEKLRDAAFVALITEDTRYSDAVLSVLLQQAAQPGTTFLPPVWSDIRIGDRFGFDLCAWLLRLLYAYDYIKDDISAADRAQILDWFNKAMVFTGAVVDDVVERAFPNRNNDDYSSTVHTPITTYSRPVTHYAGWNTYDFHEHWNNRNSIMVAFTGSAAILLGDTSMQIRMKRFFKEWLRFSVFPDGTTNDFRRWSGGIPSLGWSYANSQIGAMVILADHLARAGDNELYEFSTSEGYPSLTPAGGAKNLRNAISIANRHVNNDLERYGTNTASQNGNPAYRVSSVDGLSTHAWVYDSFLAPANVYYKDDFSTSIYLRTAAGAPAYPASPNTAGHNAWTGVLGTVPGMMLMFGQLENRVWPYGGESEVTIRPKPPILLEE